jgi:hypothetical protein
MCEVTVVFKLRREEDKQSKYCIKNQKYFHSQFSVNVDANN